MIRRLTTALAAGAALLTLILGIPAALLTYGRSPLDGHGSLWEQLSDLPTQTVSDNVAFGALTIAAWVVWALFIAHVATEAAASLGAGLRWRIPAVGPMQVTARRLVGAITMTLTLTGPLGQRAGTVPHLPAATVTAEEQRLTAGPAGPPPSAPPRIAVAPTSIVASPEAPAAVRSVTDGPTAARHPGPGDVGEADGPSLTVGPGDTPWGLAERHLGHGLRWRDIWDLNRGVPQLDGRAWTSEDLIHPGWHFRMPADATDLPDTAPDPDQPTPDDGAPDLPGETVEPSDTNQPPVSPPGDAGEASTGETGTAGPSGDEENGPVVDGQADHGDGGGQPPRPPEAGTDAAPSTTTTTSERSPDPDDDGGEDVSAGSGPPHSDDGEGTSLPAVPLLGAAGTFLAAGVVRELRRRRARRAAGRPVGVVPPPSPRVPAGPELYARADVHVADRLDTALVQLASALQPRPGQPCPQPRLVQVTQAGRIDVCLHRPDPSPPAPWRPEASGLVWVLDEDRPLTPMEDLSPALPALVTIGAVDGDDILVDLEAPGVVSLVGDTGACRDLARSMIAELSARSEDVLAVTLVGGVLGDSEVGFDSVDRTASWEETTAGTIDSSIRLLHAGGWPHTWAARASGHVYDNWPPSIWITEGSDDPAYLDTVEAIAGRPGTGSALVVVGADPGRGLRIYLDPDGGFHLPEHNLHGRAQTISHDVPGQLLHLLDHADDPGTGPAMSGDPNGEEDSAEDDRSTVGSHPGSELASYGTRQPADDPDDPDEGSDRVVTFLRPDDGSTGHPAAGGPGDRADGSHAAPVDVGADPAPPDDSRSPNGSDPGDHEAQASGSDDQNVEAAVVPFLRSGGAPEVPAAQSMSDGYQDPAYDVIVRVCGPVRVEGVKEGKKLGRHEVAVTTYVALHGHADFDRLRDAIWLKTGVTIKRIKNVVSTIRSAVGDAIELTQRHHVAAGPGLITDIELIHRRIAYAKQQHGTERAATLRGALELVTGRVFDYPDAGRRSWTWVEMDDWLPHVDRLVGTVAADLATTCLELGDIDGARWAATKGIDAIGKRDDLIVLLVRAHQQAGDETAARDVIRSYERHLNDLGVDEFNDELLDLLDHYAPPVRNKE